MKLWSASLVKERTVEGFGKRLREIRQRRAMTQAELGEAVGVSNRVIAYLEDRRVLYAPSEIEIPHHCVDSVLQIREYLTHELQGLDRFVCCGYRQIAL